MKHERALELVAALRSGLYVQGEHALHQIDEEGNATFCCLGVSCDLAYKAGITKKSYTIGHGRVLYGAIPDDPDDYNTTPGQVHDGFLPNDVVEWTGSYTRRGSRTDGEFLAFDDQYASAEDRESRPAWLGTEYESLSGANDTGVPFYAIANYIEKNWQYL